MLFSTTAHNIKRIQQVYLGPPSVAHCGGWRLIPSGRGGENHINTLNPSQSCTGDLLLLQNVMKGRHLVEGSGKYTGVIMVS